MQLHYSEWTDKDLENLFLFIMDWKPIHIGNSLGKEDGPKRMGQWVLWEQSKVNDCRSMKLDRIWMKGYRHWMSRKKRDGERIGLILKTMCVETKW